MIYETAVPVSHARHGNWSLEVGTNYAFCRNINSVPLMAAEFASAALEYAVVFGEDVVMPAAVLGVRTDENLYVTKQGHWQAKYIPACVRRYPFIVSSGDESKTFTLCIDEAFAGLNQSGRGERLFGDDGKPTPYVENMLKFLQQYQLEFRRTQAFCKKLKDLNLLEPMRAQIELGSGQRMTLRGFSVVQRARLKTLRANVLAELVRSDELELIYTHVVSMRNFATLRDRLAQAQPAHSVGGGPLIH
jgi:SapC